jgi:hypothetical protein
MLSKKKKKKNIAQWQLLASVTSSQLDLIQKKEHLNSANYDG